MCFRDLVILISTFVVFCSFAFAQTQPNDTDKDKKTETEKENKQKELDDRVLQILNQSTGDAATLRLPENRAIVFAISGDLYWKFDEKRSRELFRNAAAEILIFNQDVEKEKRDNTDPYFEMFDSNDVRGQILPLIAAHDAELALDLLIQTRPVRLAEAMMKAAQPNAKSQSNFMGFDLDRQRVQQEIALEQRFALLAADENPEQAIKMIKESLSKGVSYNVLPLLQKLNKKDEKKAADLAGEVVKKFVDTDLTKNQQDMQVALNFLRYAVPADTLSNSSDAKTSSDTKMKPFKFSDSQVKDLANKIADTLQQPSKSLSLTMMMTQAIPLLDKIVPERTAALKQREAENQSNLPSEYKNVQRQMKFRDASYTPEDIIAQLPKLQSEMDKSMAYQSLNMKISQIDDDTRAKKLIDQIPDEKARANAQNTYDSARISRTAALGKFDDAHRMIDTLTKKGARVQKLVALAIQIQKKGTEKEIETAKGLMKEARSLTTDSPEDEDELNDLMEVVKGYAVVEPDIAFRMFEPMVDQINDFVYATAILSKYNKRNRTFKKGELVMKINGYNGDSMLLFRYMTQMQMLGKADLERMSVLADRFGRIDSRTLVKLFIVQGFMKDDKKPDNSTGTSSGIVIFNN